MRCGEWEREGRLAGTADEVERLRQRHHAIVELGLLSVRERGLQPLLDEAVRIVRDALDADASKILERQPGGTLLVRAGVGWPPGIVGQLELPLDGDSQASYALRLREPVIVVDLMQERRFKPSPIFLEAGVRSGVNVVIEQVPTPWGVLEVDAFTERSYTSDDIDFLQSAANLLSVAIERQHYEAERDQLIHVTAHELRNPLTAILGFSQRLVRRLRSGGATSEEQLPYAEDVYEEAQRMQRMLEMLLELGRIERASSVTVTPVPLQEFVRSVTAGVAQLYPEIRFREALPDERLFVTTDADLARMLVGNIIENAAKYSSREPAVDVVLERTQEGPRLRVADRCGGIAADELDRMFERYFRGHAAGQIRGLGLGLFVARRSAETLGWSIEVQNYPGVGCEFVIAMRDLDSERVSSR